METCGIPVSSFSVGLRNLVVTHVRLTVKSGFGVPVEKQRHCFCSVGSFEEWVRTPHRWGRDLNSLWSKLITLLV